MDLFKPYERGMEDLLARLKRDHPRYPDALTLQGRLDDTIRAARMYGDNEALRSDRAAILTQLNALTLEMIGISFNELCGLAQAEIAGTPPSPAVPKRDQSARVTFNSSFSGAVHGPVHMGQGDINVNGVRPGTGDTPAD